MRSLMHRIDTAPTPVIMAILVFMLTIAGFIYLSGISGGRNK